MPIIDPIRNSEVLPSAPPPSPLATPSPVIEQELSSPVIEPVEPLEWIDFQVTLHEINQYYTRSLSSFGKHTDLPGIPPWVFLKYFLEDTEISIIRRLYSPFNSSFVEIATSDLRDISVYQRKQYSIEIYKETMKMVHRICYETWPVLSTNITILLLQDTHLNGKMTGVQMKTLLQKKCIPQPELSNAVNEIIERYAFTVDELTGIVNEIIELRSSLLEIINDADGKKSQETIRSANRLKWLTLIHPELTSKTPLITNNITVSLDKTFGYKLWISLQEYIREKSSTDASADASPMPPVPGDKLQLWATRVKSLPVKQRELVNILQNCLVGDCAICQDSFNVVQDSIMYLQCGHCFHQGCGLTEWISSHHKCPLCNKPCNGEPKLLSTDLKEHLIIDPFKQSCVEIPECIHKLTIPESSLKKSLDNFYVGIFGGILRKIIGN